jgi:hypothetical protein
MTRQFSTESSSRADALPPSRKPVTNNRDRTVSDVVSDQLLLLPGRVSARRSEPRSQQELGCWPLQHRYRASVPIPASTKCVALFAQDEENDTDRQDDQANRPEHNADLRE